MSSAERVEGDGGPLVGRATGPTELTWCETDTNGRKTMGDSGRTTLEFTDGVKFDTTGEPHLEHRRDGWYVVGRGMVVPVDDEEDGRELVAWMKGGR